MRLIVALLVAVSLSGCLAETDSTDSLAGVETLATWTNPILAGPGGDAETSIHAGPDGIVLACTHGGFQKASPAWASYDQGETWGRLVIEPNPLVSGDCDMTILDDGTWVMVFDTIASATIATSQDQGASWSLNYLAALPIAVDRPWITHTGNRIHMVYADVMSVEPAINMYAYSDDHGVTWTQRPMASFFQEPEYFTHILGDIIVRDDGIFAPITRSNMGAGGPSDEWSLELRHSTDDGQSWTWKPITDVHASFALGSVDEDATGRFWTVIPDDQENGTALSIGWSDDAGDSWTFSDVIVEGQRLPGVTGPAVVGMDHTSGAAVAWMHLSDDGWVARAMQADIVDGELVVDPARNVTHTGGSSGDLYEFIDLDVDDEGRIYVAALINDGPECADIVFQGGRNVQCLYIAPGAWN